MLLTAMMKSEGVPKNVSVKPVKTHSGWPSFHPNWRLAAKSTGIPKAELRRSQTHSATSSWLNSVCSCEERHF